MPYLTQQHAQQVRESRETSGSGSQQRSSDEARMQCQHNIVKHQVEELYRKSPARSTEDDDFFNYQIDVNTVIFQGTYSSIYLASHSQYPEQALVGRVYEPTARIDPQRSSYMKVLSHVGRRSPNCIGTYDIFYDDAGRVVIFQEFALHGNLKNYLKDNNVYAPEPQMREWAEQIYRGMDFLGDAGICHRAISPKHVLMTVSPDDASKTMVKLGSFRDSIIYFDPKDSRVRTITCREKRDSANALFHAPEVFAKESKSGSTSKEGGKNDSSPKQGGVGALNERGGATSTLSNASAKENREGQGEQFDPIAADVWSFGATWFFANTRNYPIKYSRSQGDPAAAIQKSINYARKLSEGAKNWFSGILKPDPAQRTAFDQIAADPWFKNQGSDTPDSQQQRPPQQPGPPPQSKYN